MPGAGLEENAEDLSISSLVGGVAVLFVAYVIGGWAAGRIARYDGARNGFAAGIWTLVFAAILAGLGAWIGSEYGGLWGERYHRRADRTIVSTPPRMETRA